MKKYINRLVILSGCALAFAACDDNSWNDKLDGFEDSYPTEVQTIDYTLTDVDYKTLSSNSTNKALAGDDKAAALKAVGTQGYFTDEITAREYIPALLSDPKFPYFTLDNGSAMKVTYKTATTMPAKMQDMVNAYKYTVTEADYQTVWESETDYANAFAPSHTATRSIPAILRTAFPDPSPDDYVIVNYNNAATDPVFNATPDVPTFELTELLGTAKAGDEIVVNGYVSALCTQGFILTDKAGSIYCYRGSSFGSNNFENLKIGTQITLTGSVSARNKGIQFGNTATFEAKGEQTVTYPSPKVYSGAELDALAAQTEIGSAIYTSMTGVVSVSGNYINLKVDGATTQGSPSYVLDGQKALLSDGAVVIVEGYIYAISGGTKYATLCVTNVKSASSKTSAKAVSRAVEVTSVNENALYTFDGSSWKVASDAVVLSHADYQAMGQRYDNLSGETPAVLLPIFMKQKYPYAQAEDSKFVVYYYYTGSETVIRCDQYVFDGTAWVANNGIVEETAQFVKTGGKWMYDPNVTINLPAGKGIEISTLYYQTCVDWVKNNVENGAAYVSSYGNNEYYCGTSAYQGNVDLRPTAAKTQYAGYADMTDDAVVALEKQRFETEVFPAALSILHADAAPVEGLTVLFTINFYYYDGTTKPATIVYEVTAPGTFTFVSCTWNDETAE